MRLKPLQPSMLLLVAAASVAFASALACAATITSPTGNPYAVPGDGSGNPQPFTVSVSGYPAGSLVYVEQCDGTPATAPGWSPTANCDLGSSPAGEIVAANGTATFPAADQNHGFHPFKGPSPQGLFNCLSPNQPSPNNGLADFNDCQIRASSNNAAVTADQVFLSIALPDAPVGTTTTTTTVASTTTTTTPAGTPFGNDDSGYLPPDAPKGPIAKCENGVGKAVAKLFAADWKCHNSRAKAKFLDDAAEDQCEALAFGKFAATKILGCGACTDLAGLGATVESLVDTNNDRVYCSAGTPFGGDDAGNISAIATETKCQLGVATKLAKVVGAIFKCHAQHVVGKFDDGGEDACEATAIGKFMTTKTVGCPACIDLSALAAWVQQVTNTALNGPVYCAP